MITDVIDQIESYFLGRPHDDELWSPDVVVELPFARPGRPRRFVGATTFRDATRASREALPVVFEHFRTTAVHETADPEVTVLEYELGGTVLTTGKQASAAFVVVLRVRDGRVVLWREYQDMLAIADALGGLPTPSETPTETPSDA
jgi:ketosteroid isomerase-like protein